MTDILPDVLGAIGYIAVAGFISMWAHRAQEEHGRAAKMGLYLTFGFLWFIVFLVGLSRLVGELREGENPGVASITLVLLGVAAGIALIPYPRRALARILPFDPNSYPDMIGLMFILQVTIAFVGLSFLGDEEDLTVQVHQLIINALTFVAISFLAVGLFINRSFREVIERLGLVKPTGRDIAIALGCVVIALAVSIASTVLVELLQPDLVDELQETLTELPGELNVFWAAALIGLTAAVGEEILMRGAIQPRFGIIFTSLVFAVLHVQYGFSVVIVGVFFAGIVFGLERKYVNTAACIITHMIYNFIAVLANTAISS